MFWVENVYKGLWVTFRKSINYCKRPLEDLCGKELKHFFRYAWQEDRMNSLLLFKVLTCVTYRNHSCFPYQPLLLWVI